MRPDMVLAKTRLLCVPLLTCLISLAGCHDGKQDALTDCLNHTIENKASFTREKERKIEEVKQMFRADSLSAEREYEINLKLYKEYKKYILDSAVFYVERNLEIARKINSPRKIYQSLLELAPLYSFSGKYIESQAVLNSIDPSQLPEDLLSRYYEVCIQFYDHYGLASSNKYDEIKAALRDSLMKTVDPRSRTYRSNQVTLLMNSNDPSNYAIAERILTDLLAQTPKDTPDYASSNHQMAKLSKRMNRLDLAKKYYTISAITDIRCAIKETSALQNLALIYFDAGDEKSAFKYAQSAIEDAVFGGAQLRTTQMAEFYTMVNASFRDKEAAVKRKLQWSLIFISLLSLCLLLLMIQILKQMKNISKIKERLSESNARLTEQNREIIETNNLLTESNMIKEQYITQFFDLHSNYINKFETYRKSLNRLAMNRQMDELFRQLKSNKLIELEIDELYNHFDNIFLGLYPNFISDFNALLKKDEQIIPKSGHLLNTELRIYALLRLGITDSAQIASFLRCSITTIYNYRTKVRNCAIISRDDFEIRVRKIGSERARNNK